MAHRLMLVMVAAAWLMLALGGCGGAPPPPDETPPTVLFTEPADGARGVLKDVVLKVHFSEPMDPSCTEDAYGSYDAGLQPGEVTFSWPDAQTLVITPNDPLAYSDDANDKVYTFTIHKTACDLAGNPLPAQTVVRFYVLRKLQGTLTSEAAIDGYVFNTGRVDTAGRDLGAGDGPNGEYAHAFLSFDLSQLNPDPVEIVTSQLSLTKELVMGHPSQNLGDLLVEHVYFGPSLSRLGARALELAPLTPDPPCAFTDVSRSLFLCWKAVAVQDDVDHWLERNGRSQFRLRFAIHTDGNGSEDSVMFYSGDDASRPPTLEVVYYGP
ncbi:Ig-like domain-containing protein [Oceanithermus desulfurans]|uniref:SbsA Ig-like domain-containing protein n=2 Tax=Oceanithermus desulfurans TaxID=227924 RepID=A0A511RLU5_9DEIN|nr:Ig-like domain-containing protein [Oceanithermus desulfurans]MBB6030784.1 hypothetical protein [Oceanithermus desulfurans]GEM90631.1 hypothetical protein ODE01S_20650 [Oceanithermus desulfurans NBRC 100063]